MKIVHKFDIKTIRKNVQNISLFFDGQFEVDVGIIFLIDAVKGKKISIFLQIWTTRCVYHTGLDINVCPIPVKTDVGPQGLG